MWGMRVSEPQREAQVGTQHVALQHEVHELALARDLYQASRFDSLMWCDIVAGLTSCSSCRRCTDRASLDATYLLRIESRRGSARARAMRANCRS